MRCGFSRARGASAIKASKCSQVVANPVGLPNLVSENSMAERISSAKQFFEDIVNNPDPALYLRGLVTDPPSVYENDWRNFEEGEHFKDEDAKKLWSKALSGFANTGGGVIVWGIKAKKDSNGIDAANDVSPVPEAAKLRSRLMELHHQATDPPVPAVDVRHFVDATNGDAGYVVCFVPEGISKPHREIYNEQAILHPSW